MKQKLTLAVPAPARSRKKMKKKRIHAKTHPLAVLTPARQAAGQVLRTLHCVESRASYSRIFKVLLGSG